MDPRTQQEEKRAEREGLVYIRQRYQVHGPRLEEDGEEGYNGEDGDREGYAYDLFLLRGHRKMRRVRHHQAD